MGRSAAAEQSLLPLALHSDEHLSISDLEIWLWDAAYVIRGAADVPKYKDFILPLIFYKRLSDVFDDEFAQYVELYDNDERLAYQIIRDDHRQALLMGRAPIVRFLIPDEYRWIKLRNHGADTHLGEFVTDVMRAVADLNPAMRGVLDVKDYNERQSGQRSLDDDRLAALIEVISRHHLGLHNTEPDILGRAYEYLLRKFAEGQGRAPAHDFSQSQQVADFPDVRWRTHAMKEAASHTEKAAQPAAFFSGEIVLTFARLGLLFARWRVGIPVLSVWQSIGASVAILLHVLVRAIQLVLLELLLNLG